MSGLKKEGIIFLHALISGMMVYGVYFLIERIREKVHHKLYVIEIEDFLFWVGTGLYLFIQIYHTSDGTIRWYFILGVVLGMILLSSILFQVRKRYQGHDKSVDKNRENS